MTNCRTGHIHPSGRAAVKSSTWTATPFPGPRNGLLPYLERGGWGDSSIRVRSPSPRPTTIQPVCARWPAGADSVPPRSGFPTVAIRRFSTRGASCSTEYGNRHLVLNNILGRSNSPAATSRLCVLRGAAASQTTDWAIIGGSPPTRRWRSSICVPFEEPDLGPFQEIVRLHGYEATGFRLDQWSHPTQKKPFGNPKVRTRTIRGGFRSSVCDHLSNPGGPLNKTDGCGALPSINFENQLGTVPLAPHGHCQS